MVGLVVAWHRPQNPIGWLMLVQGPGWISQIDFGLYDVLSYRLGHQLPLAPAGFWDPARLDVKAVALGTVIWISLVPLTPLLLLTGRAVPSFAPQKPPADLHR